MWETRDPGVEPLTSWLAVTETRTTEWQPIGLVIEVLTGPRRDNPTCCKDYVSCTRVKTGCHLATRVAYDHDDLDDLNDVAYSHLSCHTSTNPLTQPSVWTLAITLPELHLDEKMPPKQAQQKPKPNAANPPSQNMANNSAGGQQGGIPDHEIKQNAGVSASMALQAGQKAWELRQAAHGAGDAKAREEILAKAINKEIEAESFGKAAKYTQSGAFQGLAAGAGLGVQPGVTIGKLTGALVGGTISTVTGLLGGGIGSVYGAMNGPMWDLGEMASQGVQGVVGDFLPDIKSTPSQKKALEKMIMQTKETQAPSKEELEQMKNDAPDQMPQSWSQSAKDMTAWRPSMPSMPSAKGMGGALGLGGIGAAMNPWGGQSQQQQQQQQPQQSSSQPKQQPQKQAQQAPSQPKQSTQPQKNSQTKPQQPKTNNPQPPKQEKPQSNEPPKEAPKPRSQRPPTTRGPANPQSSQQNQAPSAQQTTSQSKTSSQKSNSTSKPANTSSQPKRVSFSDNKENNAPATTSKEKRKPRKLGQQGSNTQKSGGPSQPSTPKKAPRKLEPRKPAA
ncbi:uncharacterized protein AALT_g8412 [Alternaria alternata]|nr:uncharacterized protein AALT_g8412 [Alternaria alternata]